MGRDEVTIRRGRSSDLEWLAENNIALAWESESLKLEPQTARAGVESLLSDEGRGFYLVADSPGERAGQMMITPEWSDWHCGYYWWLQSVYVLPQHRGRGVFRRLFEAACTLAEETGNVISLRLYVDEFNQTAQASYRKMGMSASHYHIFELTF